MNTIYVIKRYYEDGRKPRTMRKNLTLKQAQEHCTDPSTSSLSGTGTPVKDGNGNKVHWFDGYTDKA